MDTFAQAECGGCNADQAQTLSATGQSACLGWGPVVRHASRYLGDQYLDTRYAFAMSSTVI
jgi:hypothetical protein